jgi:hypothetical protein
MLVIDSLYWQWLVKLAEEPKFSLPFPLWLGHKNIIGDILLVIVWLILLIRIYRKANQREI